MQKKTLYKYCILKLNVHKMKLNFHIPKYGKWLLLTIKYRTVNALE